MLSQKLHGIGRDERMPCNVERLLAVLRKQGDDPGMRLRKLAYGEAQSVMLKNKLNLIASCVLAGIRIDACYH